MKNVSGTLQRCSAPGWGERVFQNKIELNRINHANKNNRIGNRELLGISL